MDMLPPQAPPASVQHANQAARDTLQRLNDAQDWLTAQQQLLPNAAADIDAWWDEAITDVPGKAPTVRRDVFSRYLAQAAVDDASLRASDGTLPENVAKHVRELSRPPGAPAPTYLLARELMVGSQAYAGALLLQDIRDPAAYLFTVEGGWERFASLDALFAMVEGRLGQVMASGDSLPGIRQVEVDATVSARGIDGDVFKALAARLITHFGEQARDEAEKDYAAWRLHTLLDIHGMLAHRDLALLNLINDERLKSTPAHVEAAWREAAGELRAARMKHALAQVPGTGDTATAPVSLIAFASRELTQRLQALGVVGAPERIRLSVSNLPKSFLTYLTGGPDSSEVSLLELAFLNASCWSESMRIVTPPNEKGARLTAPAACNMVRELDLQRRYLSYLTDFKGPAYDVQLERALSGSLLQARMRLDAEDARVGYYRNSEQRSFLHTGNDAVASVDERAYRWARNIIDHPSPYARPRVDDTALKVQEVTYRGATVTDVLVISAVDEKRTPEVLAYLPEASGPAWREFASRTDFERGVLLDPGFERYLLDRLPREFSTTRDDGTRRFTLSYAAELRYKALSGANDCGFCTRVEEPFKYQEATTSFLDDVYFAKIDLTKAHARYVTRATQQADDDALGALFWLIHTREQVIASLATGLVMSFPLAAQAAWRFEDSVRNGDYVDAFLAAKEGYLQALNVLPLYHALPKTFAGHILRSGARGTVESVGRGVARPDTLFEARFIARGVKAPKGPAPKDGIYRIDGAAYIRQGESFYQVHFDDAAQAWRLTRAGAPNKAANGPLVERLADGTWRFQRSGLLGGIRTYGNRSESFSTHAEARGVSLFNEWFQTRHLQLEPVHTLSYAQFVALRSRLSELLGPLTAARVWHIRGLNRPGSLGTLTARHQSAWNDAMAYARATPRDASLPFGALGGPAQLPPTATTRAGAFALDVATPAALDQLRARVIPAMADFSAVEFEMLANRLNALLGPARARRVFHAAGFRAPLDPAESLPAATAAEVAALDESLHWVIALRPQGTPPIPAVLDG
jgi:hypothetical protein